MRREDLTTEECQKVWDAVRYAYVWRKKSEKTYDEWLKIRKIYFKIRRETSDCKHCGTCESCKILKSCNEKYKKSIKIRDDAHKKYEESLEVRDLSLENLVQISDDEF